MKKWIIILFAMLIFSSIVSADYLDSGNITNTFINFTLIIDSNITFTTLTDNESGVYFEDLIFGSLNCSDRQFTTENTTTNTSEFPLTGWVCVAYPPPTQQQTIDNSSYGLVILMSILALFAIIVPAMMLIYIIQGGELPISVLITTAVSIIALFVGIAMFFIVRSILIGLAAG